MTSVCGLLLPGMTLNATIFPDLPFPTISVDFNTAPPVSSGQADLMQDYVTALMDRLDGSQPWQTAQRRIVIGHSFGGMLAQRWLSSGHPTSQQVDRLLLVATTAGPMYDVVKLKIGKVGGKEMRLPIDTLMGFWNSSPVTKLMKRVMTGGTLAVHQVDFRTLSDPTDLKIDFAGWRNTDWRAMQSFRRAMKGFDVRGQLSNIATQTVVMHGSDDALFPTSVGEALATGLPNGRFKRVEGARHVLPLTHGAAVRDAAIELLSS